MHAADELPGLRAGTGLTVLTWLMRVGFFGLAADRGCGGRRRRPAGRVADRAAGRAGGCGAGRRAQTDPDSWIVSTPAAISAMPAAIVSVNGSSNSTRATRATSATPHADHTP